MKIDVYEGTCDVSAGVWWNGFLIVASDEDNVLRAYRPGSPQPVELLEFSKLLEVDEDEPETDLEGAAVAADGTTYWIGSHGRSRKGRRRRSRERFFATRFVDQAGRPSVEVVGTPFKGLRNALRDSVAGDKARLDRASRRAPEAKGGFSIEGIAFRGEDLLVAFRNPAPRGLALLVPLRNPRAVVLGSEEPDIGAPLFIDLGGRGIRALTPVPGGFLIIAGPYDDAAEFALYFWTGDTSHVPREVPVADAGWAELNPEEILVVPEPGRWVLTVLSDDGGRRIGTTSCKKARPEKRRFRVARLEIAPPSA